MAKQAMLDLVPFARTGWKVADLDLHVQFVRRLLQFVFPEAVSRAVAAPTVGGDQQPADPRVAVTLSPQSTPPLVDRGHRKLCRVLADADADPCRIAPQVIDSLGNGLALLFVRKVVRLHRDRLPLTSPRSPRILVFSNQVLLLGVHREGGLAGSMLGRNTACDVLNLSVPVRVLFALDGLAVRRQTLSQVFQQFGDRRVADRVLTCFHLLGQVAGALASPFQRRHRVAARQRLDESLQRLAQRRVFFLGALSTAPLSPLRTWRKTVTGMNFVDSIADRAIGETRRLGHRRNAAASQRHCLDSRPTPPATFVELVGQTMVLRANPFDNCSIHHASWHDGSC